MFADTLYCINKYTRIYILRGQGMSSVIVMLLLFVVMLLIISSYLIGIVLEKRRYKRALGSEARLTPYTLDRHNAGILPLQTSNVMSVTESKLEPLFTLPASWYNRRRTFVSLGFLTMVLLTLFVQS